MMKILCIVLIFGLLSNYGSAKPAELDANLSVSNPSMLSTSSYGSIMDGVTSSLYDATSKASNLVDYNSLINNNPLMSLTDSQYLSQLGSFPSEKLNLIADVLQMSGDVIISHLEWKLQVIKAAKKQFDLAMHAFANGDLESAKNYIYDAICTLPTMCPLFHALKYAYDNEDYDMMHFLARLGTLLMSRMETAANASVSV